MGGHLSWVFRAVSGRRKMNPDVYVATLGEEVQTRQLRAGSDSLNTCHPMTSAMALQAFGCAVERGLITPKTVFRPPTCRTAYFTELFSPQPIERLEIESYKGRFTSSTECVLKCQPFSPPHRTSRHRALSGSCGPTGAATYTSKAELIALLNEQSRPLSTAPSTAASIQMYHSRTPASSGWGRCRSIGRYGS